MTIIRRIDGTTWTTCPGIDLLTFPGGEPHVNTQSANEIAEHRFVVDARVDSWNVLGEALVARDALRRNGASWVALYCPYLPGARQDRGAPLTAKVYADVINQAEFDRVVCVDPHSDVMPALLNNVAIVPAALAIAEQALAGENTVLICPDAGAVKRTEAVATAHRKPVIYARKHRDPATGRLSGFSCEPLPLGAVGVVVDDICDGGGTFLGIAQALGVPRERLRLWTTHGIYSHGLAELRSRYSFIGCSDSYPSKATPDLVRPLLTQAMPLLLP